MRLLDTSFIRKIWFRLLASLPGGDVSVLIDSGSIIALQGKLKPHFHEALRKAAGEFELDDGCLQATRVGAGLYRLTMSGIPAEAAQRFRNIWNAEAE